MEWLIVCLFASAVSADGFMVGVAYGLKQIKIPVLSLAVIALSSALAVTLSMLCGMALASFFTPDTAYFIGAAILIVIGAYFLLQACRQRILNLDLAKGEESPLLSLNVKSLGIVIQILKHPSDADMDSSGEISTKEAFFLGLALAMDAFGAGIGVAMAGFNILLTAICVGVLKFILINSGLYLGRILQNERINNLSSLVTGLILIAIGVSELI